MNHSSARTHSRPYLHWALACALLGLGAGCGNSPSPPPGGYTAGDKIPDFSLMDAKGQSLSFLRTQPDWFLVIFLYRGIYCGSCKQSLFAFKDDYAKFIAARVTLVAISTDRYTDAMDFDQTWKFPFPLLADPDLTVIDAFRARHVGGHGIHDIAYPSILIIDPQKVLRYKQVAKNPDELPNSNEILQLVARFRAGR